MIGQDAPETERIHVYRADPVWARYDRWFLVPQADLTRLYLGTYLVQVESDSCMERHARALRERHGHDVVLVGMFP